MTQQTINIGSAPADGTGDPLRTAFTKSNDNFTELYARGGGTTTTPQGRLTLATGAPVMTTTQAAKTTIYYTPYVGNQVPIYNGTTMTMTTFAELSVATTDTTKSPAAIGASKVNDWFVWNDAGTIRLSHGPDWTSDTARSAGTALVMVYGIWLNNVAITNGPAIFRGTYVGTTRSNASSQLDWINGGLAAGGTAAWFGVWNAYNRRSIATMVADSTDSWAYSVATWRAANASLPANMRATIVSGLKEDWLTAQYVCPGLSVTSNSAVAIGFNSTSTPGGAFGMIGTGTVVAAVAISETQPFGVNFVAAMEYGSAAGCTFYGDVGTNYFQNGLHVLFYM